MVKLASDTFNYTRIDREKAHLKQMVSERFPKVGRKFHRLGLPPKVSSSLSRQHPMGTQSPWKSPRIKTSGKNGIACHVNTK